MGNEYRRVMEVGDATLQWITRDWRLPVKEGNNEMCELIKSMSGYNPMCTNEMKNLLLHHVLAFCVSGISP